MNLNRSSISLFSDQSWPDLRGWYTTENIKHIHKTHFRLIQMSHKPIKSNESWATLKKKFNINWANRNFIKAYRLYWVVLISGDWFLESFWFVHFPMLYVITFPCLDGSLYMLFQCIHLLQGWAWRENNHWRRHVGNVMISIFVFMTRACSLCSTLDWCLLKLGWVSAAGLFAFSQDHAVSIFPSFSPWRTEYLHDFSMRLSEIMIPCSPPATITVRLHVLYHLLCFAFFYPLCILSVCIFPSVSCVCCHHDSDPTTTAESEEDRIPNMLYLLSGIIILYFRQN